MGSFDRKPPGQQGSSKKGVLVALLGGVMVLVVVRAVVKVQPSDAAVAGPAKPAPARLDDSPAAARAALDEVVSVGWKSEPVEGIDMPPADPFQLSPAWRDKLLRPIAVATPVHQTIIEPVVIKQHDRTNPVAAPVPLWDVSGLKLTGIFRDNRRAYAVINGSIMSEGMNIGGGKIVEIADDRVTLQQLGGADMPKVELVINRGKMK